MISFCDSSFADYGDTILSVQRCCDSVFSSRLVHVFLLLIVFNIVLSPFCCLCYRNMQCFVYIYISLLTVFSDDVN